MFLTLQDLKVDQTALPSGNFAILVSNINIPESEFNNLDVVIERAKNFIVSNYQDAANILFQVCATYKLKHIESGDTRQWTGSFNPKGNQINTLCHFQQFTPQFNIHVKNACTEDNVHRRLRFYHVETSWVFDRLTSIIIYVQSLVNLQHQTIVQKVYYRGAIMAAAQLLPFTCRDAIYHLCKRSRMEKTYIYRLL